MEVQMISLVRNDLLERGTDLPLRKRVRHGAIKPFCDHFCREEHNQLQAHTHQASTLAENTFSPVVSRSLRVHTLEDLPKDSSVSALLGNEQSKGFSVVVIDAGQPGAPDLVDDPAFTGLAEKEPPHRAGEVVPPLRRNAELAIQGRERSGPVPLEVLPPSFPRHESLQ